MSTPASLCPTTPLIYLVDDDILNKLTHVSLIYHPFGKQIGKRGNYHVKQLNNSEMCVIIRGLTPGCTLFCSHSLLCLSSLNELYEKDMFHFKDP